MEWTKELIDKLIKLYPNHTNKEISKLLDVELKNIINKSKKLKLKKDKYFVLSLKRENAQKRKKYINLEELIRIAKSYSSRYEFQKNDLLAYRIARRDGFIDKVCSHMKKQRYSCPQLALHYIVKKILNTETIYNGRKIIPPYELDIYLPKYKLAFEYDGKPWHKNNKNDLIKNEICKNKKINLIRIVEKSRNYLNDIKTQLITNIKVIGEYTNIKISVNDIFDISNDEIKDFIKQNVINENKVKEIIKKYKTIGDFKKQEPYLYGKLSRSGSLAEYTQELKRQRIKWDKKIIEKKISKYIFLNDFTKNENACYLYIHRNKLEYMLDGLKSKVSPPITKEKILDNVLNNNYRNIYEFQKKQGSMYQKAWRIGLLSEIKEIINNYKSE